MKQTITYNGAEIVIKLNWDIVGWTGAKVFGKVEGILKKNILLYSTSWDHSISPYTSINKREQFIKLIPDILDKMENYYKEHKEAARIMRGKIAINREDSFMNG